MNGREQRPPESARVLVGLRDKLIADALGRLLGDAGIQVCACLCEPAALLEHAVRALPDAVVIASGLLGGSGDLPILAQLRTRAPSVRVVVMARDINENSARAKAPFITINCGAFPETLLESELFGYMRGAFTGANENRRGLFQAADGGTLFMDEIGNMSLTMQVKLYRVLEEGKVRPLGST